MQVAVCHPFLALAWWLTWSGRAAVGLWGVRPGSGRPCEWHFLSLSLNLSFH